MLSFFKVNDPFRIIGIILLIGVLRLPYILMDIPLLAPELMWMLTGERMSAGHNMYVEIIDDNGPYSVGIYWLLDSLFGRSLLAYQVLAGMVMLFQIMYVNHLFIKYRSFDDNTYLPAMVMAVLFHLSFDFLTLSPALLGTTFVILSLGRLFSLTLLNQDSTESVLMVGIFGGIAVCFHLPLVFFLPFLIVTGIIVSGFNFHQLILSLVGYLQPIALVSLYYFWIDGLQDFILEFIFATRIIDTYQYVSYWDILILFIVPIGFALSGFFMSSVLQRHTVNQQKQQQIMLIFLLFAILALFLANRKNPYQLVVLLPGLTYFITQIFIYVEKKVVLKSFFYGFVIIVPLVGYAWTLYKFNTESIYTYAINANKKYDYFNGKSIVVLGSDIGYYKDANLVTPFLNFNLSKRILADFEDYNDMTNTYLQFSNEKPQYIIDEEGVFRSLLIRIPALEALYIEENEGIYKLRATKN
ncbi:hypothetical protein [Anditalea andensis]|uniref:Glycosyltransferase RgtA/B/C/D-like domain-containing protein n=1 Tax=Anditalea andensis TaxID=1048983 RepID=A0A074L022_9BACT|nr:hypothetical protein [Anditalea andensis]KEO73203.1 hypothetical protein EL17_12670 [Anditalea andensis]